MGRLWALLAVLACARGVAQTHPVEVASPNGQLVMRLTTLPVKGTAGGKLVYSVTFRGKPVIANSALALALSDGPPLGSDVQMEQVDLRRGLDDYTLLHQKTSHVHDAYNAATVLVHDAAGRMMEIEARVYEGGVAFRYVVPAQSGMPTFQLKQEMTEFRLTSDATDWLLALPNYRSSYESEYVKLPTTALSNQGGVPSSFLIGLPLLLHEPGVAWMALEEADIEGYSSMYVTNPSGNWAGKYFVSKLSPRWDDAGMAVEGALPHHSAWRVLLVADDPGRLVESTIQYDLNPANRLADVSWIRAGKASWNWWADNARSNGKAEFSTDTMKEYVDFAAKSGFAYFLLDAGWTAHGDLTQMNGKVDIPELVAYAAKKHVKVWIWCYAGAVAKQMKDAFPVFERWGVAGVKIDFIDRDDQDGVQFYYDVAREAAAHHLMVDFHGTRTPWGLERTYPNVMSYEGVLGAENNKVGRRDNPEERATLAFTRLLVGPMDYTPGGFNNATEDGFVAQNSRPMVMGTRAQQLALYVIFQTPFQMVSDSPDAYEGQAGFQFLKDVPAEWDATRVLNGRPGEFATVARRHGSEWFLGSMTNWTPRTLDVPLDFLGDGAYRAEIYADGDDAASQPKQVAIRTQVVHAGERLSLKLAPGGGCAIRFVPLGRN